MAGVGTNYVTLSDMSTQTDPDGSLASRIVSRVARQNDLISMLPFTKGNRSDGDQITNLTSLPTIGYIKINKAPTFSKAGHSQITNTVGIIKVLNKVDPELAKRYPNPEQYRINKDLAFTEAIRQQVASDVVYANKATTPEKFDGLAVRYGTVSTVRNNPGYYMIDGAGAGSDNMSIWLAKVGPEGLHGIVGKESEPGLTTKDKGVHWLPDASGNSMEWMVTEFRWELGIQVANPGAVVRICNIDKSNLIAESSAADLSKLIFRAQELLEDVPGQGVILCNKTARAHLAIQASTETTLGLTDKNATFAEKVPSINGMPVLLMDALTGAEAEITGTFSSDI